MAKYWEKYLSKASHLLLSLLRLVLIFGLAFVILKPFFNKILLSFMSSADLLDSTVRYVPTKISFHFWQVALEGLDLSNTAVYSILAAIAVGVIQTLSSSMVGYGLARFKFIGSKILFAFVIIIMLIPPQVYKIAQYLGFVFFKIGPLNLNLTNTFVPLCIMSFTGLGLKEGLYIYLMRAFFKGLPESLENAAYIDGASPLKTFIYVILPNARTLLMTVFLFSFCWQWTDESYGSLYLTSISVIPQKVEYIMVRLTTGYDPVASSIAQNTACLIILIPLIILFVFCQKFLIKGIAQTGLAN